MALLVLERLGLIGTDKWFEVTVDRCAGVRAAAGARAPTSRGAAALRECCVCSCGR